MILVDLLEFENNHISQLLIESSTLSVYLNLFSLEHRRLRAGLILANNIVKGESTCVHLNSSFVQPELD